MPHTARLAVLGGAVEVAQAEATGIPMDRIVVFAVADLGLAEMECGLLWRGNESWWRSYATDVPAADNIRQARDAATCACQLQGKQIAGDAVAPQEIAALLDRALLSNWDALAGRTTLQGISAHDSGGEIRAEMCEFQVAPASVESISRQLLGPVRGPARWLAHGPAERFQ